MSDPVCRIQHGFSVKCYSYLFFTYDKKAIIISVSENSKIEDLSGKENSCFVKSRD